MNRNIITDEVLGELTDIITFRAYKNPTLLGHIIALANASNIPVDDSVVELLNEIKASSSKQLGNYDVNTHI